MNDPSSPALAAVCSRRVAARARGRPRCRRRRRRAGRLREHHDAGAPRGAGGGGKGILGDPTAGGPVDAAGIPLARRDYPVTLPRLGDAVKSSAKPERGGELRDLQLRRLPQPGGASRSSASRRASSVRVTTFDTLDEAFSKLATGGLKFDVIFSSPDQLSRLVGRQLDPAAQLRADPEPAEERLARAARPVLRRRPALHGPVHRLHDRDRLAQRPARASTRPSSTSRGTRSGRPRSTAAAWRSSTTRARRSGMALMRRGDHRPQHRGARRCSSRRVDDLSSSTSASA